jgi:hypothetical protein
MTVLLEVSPATYADVRARVILHGQPDRVQETRFSHGLVEVVVLGEVALVDETRARRRGTIVVEVQPPGGRPYTMEVERHGGREGVRVRLPGGRR